jgi:hypothetical protein
MSTPTHPPVPGSAMSYSDLLRAPQGSQARKTWVALLTLGEALGVDTTDGRPMARTATIGELVEAIRPALGEGTDIVAVAFATQALTPDVPAHTTVFEVRRLSFPHQVGEPQWVTQDRAETHEEAERLLADLRATMTPAPYVIVRTTTTTEVRLV